MDIKNLLSRIDASMSPSLSEANFESGSDIVNTPVARDWVNRQGPLNPEPPSSRTGIAYPFLSQSIASIAGVSHDVVIKFMEMLERGMSWVTAAESLDLSTGQAMDIKSAMVSVGAYKQPGQLAEELRIQADSLYRLADAVIEDEDRIFEASAVIRRLTVLSESGPDILDADLPGDASILARAYADAIADMLTLPPDNPPVIWGEVAGDEDEANVEGTVGGKTVRVHVSMVSTEVPFMRFSVPQQGSKVTMKLTSHNWMAPLTLTMQHVTRALLQSEFDYSELEQHKRINPKG